MGAHSTRTCPRRKGAAARDARPGGRSAARRALLALAGAWALGCAPEVPVDLPDAGPDGGGGEHADVDGGPDGGREGGGPDGGRDGGGPDGGAAKEPGSVCQKNGEPCGGGLACYLVSPSSLQGFCASPCEAQACPAGSRCSGGDHPYCAVDCTGDVQCPAGSLCYPGNPGMCLPDCRAASGFCGGYDCRGDGTCQFY